MIHAGNFGATTSAAVTSVAGSFLVPGSDIQNQTYIVSSDRNMHIDREAVAARATSMRVPVGIPVKVVCFGGETLSFITALGEADGTIWITHVD